MSSASVAAHVSMMVDVGMQYTFQIGLDLDLSERIVGWIGLHRRSTHFFTWVCGRRGRSDRRKQRRMR